MNIKTKDRFTIIANKEYSIRLLNTSLGIKVKEKIMKAMAPSVGVLVDYIQKGEDLLPDEANMFTDLAIALVSNIRELDVVSTIQLLLADSYCDGQKIDFEDHFAGNYTELYLLVEFALKENFGNFFTEYLKVKGLSLITLREMVPKVQTEDVSLEK